MNSKQMMDFEGKNKSHKIKQDIANIIHKLVVLAKPSKFYLLAIFFLKTFLMMIFQIQIRFASQKGVRINTLELFCMNGPLQICLWTSKLFFYLKTINIAFGFVVLVIVLCAFLKAIFLFLALFSKKKSTFTRFVFLSNKNDILRLMTVYFLSEGWKLSLIIWINTYSVPFLNSQQANSIFNTIVDFLNFSSLCGIVFFIISSYLIGFLGFSRLNFLENINFKFIRNKDYLDNSKDLIIILIAGFLSLSATAYYLFIALFTANFFVIFFEMKKRYFLIEKNINFFYLNLFLLENWFVYLFIVFSWLIYFELSTNIMELVVFLSIILILIIKLGSYLSQWNQDSVIFSLDKCLSDKKKSEGLLSIFQVYSHLEKTKLGTFCFRSKIKVNSIHFGFYGILVDHTMKCIDVYCLCHNFRTAGKQSYQTKCQNLEKIIFSSLKLSLQEITDSDFENKNIEHVIHGIQYLNGSFFPLIKLNAMIKKELSLLDEIKLRIVLLEFNFRKKDIKNENIFQRAFDNLAFQKMIQIENEIKKMKKEIKAYVRTFTYLKDTICKRKIDLLTLKRHVETLRKIEVKYFMIFSKAFESPKIQMLDRYFRTFFRMSSSMVISQLKNKSPSIEKIISINDEFLNIDTNAFIQAIFCQKDCLKITYCSNDIDSITGFNKNAILGSTPNFLLPDSFHSLHNSAVLNFMSEGIGKRMGLNVDLFIANSQKNLTPLKILMMYFFDYINSEIIFMVKLEKNIKKTNSIVCDKFGRIILCTQGIEELTSLSKVIQTDFPVYLLFEQISKYVIELISNDFKNGSQNNGAKFDFINKFSITDKIIRNPLLIEVFEQQHANRDSKIHLLSKTEVCENILETMKFYDRFIRDAPVSYSVKLNIEVLHLFNDTFLEIVLLEDNERIKQNVNPRKHKNLIYRIVILKIMTRLLKKKRNWSLAIRGLLLFLFNQNARIAAIKQNNAQLKDQLTAYSTQNENFKNMKIGNKFDKVFGFIPATYFYLNISSIVYFFIIFGIISIILIFSYSNLQSIADDLFTYSEIQFENSIISFLNSVRLTTIYNQMNSTNELNYLMHFSRNEFQTQIENFYINSDQVSKLDFNSTFFQLDVLENGNFVTGNFYFLLQKIQALMFFPSISTLNLEIFDYICFVFFSNFQKRVYNNAFLALIPILEGELNYFYISMGSLIVLYLVIFLVTTYKLNSYTNFIYESVLFFDNESFSGTTWNKMCHFFGFKSLMETFRQETEQSNSILNQHQTVVKLKFVSKRIVLYVLITSFVFTTLILGAFFAIDSSSKNLKILFNIKNQILLVRFHWLSQLDKILHPESYIKSDLNDLFRSLDSLKDFFLKSNIYSLENGKGIYTKYSTDICLKNSMKEFKSCQTIFNGILKNDLVSVLSFGVSKINSWKEMPQTTESINDISFFMEFVGFYLNGIYLDMCGNYLRWKNMIYVGFIVYLPIAILVFVFSCFYFYFKILKVLKNELISSIRILNFLNQKKALCNSLLRGFVEKIS